MFSFFRTVFVNQFAWRGSRRGSPRPENAAVTATSGRHEYKVLVIVPFTPR
jgi:hypothetical protein